MVILDDVFVPNDLIFMDVVHEFAAMLVERFGAARVRSISRKNLRRIAEGSRLRLRRRLRKGRV